MPYTPSSWQYWLPVLRHPRAGAGWLPKDLSEPLQNQLSGPRVPWRTQTACRTPTILPLRLYSSMVRYLARRLPRYPRLEIHTPPASWQCHARRFVPQSLSNQREKPPRLFSSRRPRVQGHNRPSLLPAKLRAHRLLAHLPPILLSPLPFEASLPALRPPFLPLARCWSESALPRRARNRHVHHIRRPRTAFDSRIRT